MILQYKLCPINLRENLFYPFKLEVRSLALIVFCGVMLSTIFSFGMHLDEQKMNAFAAPKAAHPDATRKKKWFAHPIMSIFFTIN
jgi:hypothetical protein